MTKFRKPNDHAAYEIAVGVTDRDEAAGLGLAVVEVDATSGAPTAYGRYLNAPDGHPLGETVADNGDTKVVGAGSLGPAAPAAAPSGKGNLVNPDDPVIHGGSDDIHRDGAEPPVEDLATEEREAARIARASIENAGKSAKRK